ncbi:hypothetical protein SH139x_004518 [Planctomycetaceae bacterium SH139]
MKTYLQKTMLGLLLAVPAALVVAVPQAGIAQDQAAGQPTGEAVMDGYVKAIGGKDLLKERTSRRIKATFSMPAAGVAAGMTITQKAPAFYRMEMEIPGLGTMTRICDGKQVYDNNAVTGERILSGGEKEAAMLEAQFNSDLNWRDSFKSVKLVGNEKIDGRDCWKVSLTTQGGAEQIRYFDVKTNLLVQTEMTVDTPQGKIPTVTRIPGYKEIDGIKYPKSSEISMLGQKQVITIDSVEHDLEPAAATFEIPKAGN